MSICWHRYIDVHLAAPAPRVRDRRELRPSAGSAPSPRGAPLRAAPRVIFAWLRGFLPPTVRSQASSFRGSLDTPSKRQPSEPRMLFASLSSLQDGAGGGDALTYPTQMAALGRVVASTQGVLAAQAHVAAHKAARSPNP